MIRIASSMATVSSMGLSAASVPRLKRERGADPRCGFEREDAGRCRLRHLVACGDQYRADLLGDYRVVFNDEYRD